MSVTAFEFMPTEWTQGAYTVTRQRKRKNDRCVFEYTIRNDKAGGSITFRANCGYLASYHSEREIMQKWMQQQMIQNATRRLAA
jgi:hypothetical protein